MWRKEDFKGLLLTEVLAVAFFKPYIQILILPLAAFRVSEMIWEKKLSLCIFFFLTGKTLAQELIWGKENCLENTLNTANVIGKLWKTCWVCNQLRTQQFSFLVRSVTNYFHEVSKSEWSISGTVSLERDRTLCTRICHVQFCLLLPVC